MNRPTRTFACYLPDPDALGRLRRRLNADARWDSVHSPADGWVAAQAAPEPAGGTVLRIEGAPVAPGVQLADLGGLPGDFGFVAIDAEGALAVRSAGGAVPLHVHRAGERLAVATNLADLVAYLPDAAQIDPLAWACWLSGFGAQPYRRSLLAGTLSLSRGHAVQLAPGRPIRPVRYHDPFPAGYPTRRETPSPEHAARLRELLLAGLAADLDPAGGNLLSLSGGVDSTALGALAAGTVGRPVSSVSLVPPEHDPARGRELGYLRNVSERYGFVRRLEVPMTLAGNRALLADAPPAVVPVLHPVLRLLPRLQAEAELRVLFGGEFADEACGSFCTIPDWSLATPPWALRRGLPTGRRDLARWGFWQLAWPAGRARLPWLTEPPGFLAPAVRAEYRQWQRDALAAAGRSPRAWRYLRAWTDCDGWVTMNWEVTSGLGIHRSIPFLQRGVLELLGDCHPAELVGPGTKKLLRAALRGLVPDRNLDRPDKGAWSRPAGLPPARVDYPIPPLLAGLIDERIQIGSLLPAAAEGLLAAACRAALQLQLLASSGRD